VIATPGGEAWFRGRRARQAVESIDLRTQSHRLQDGGFWVVVGDFEGTVRAWRFAEATTREATTYEADGVEARSGRSAPGMSGDSRSSAGHGAGWTGPAAAEWVSSMNATE
jgi:para-aminobenzoate synthetase component 1